MKIVSLTPATTDILCQLGAKDELACVSSACDARMLPPDIPRAGDLMKIDEDKVASFAPDLVISSIPLHAALVHRLNARGVRSFNIVSERLSDIIESYNQIAALTGRKEQGDEIVRWLYKKMMSSFVQPEGYQNPRVYVEEWGDPATAAGFWVPELVDLAGGVPGFSNPGESGVEVDEVQIQEFNPHLIFAVGRSVGGEQEVEMIKKRQGWEDLIAVKRKNIFPIRESLVARATSRVFTALDQMKEEIAKIRLKV